MKISIQKGLFLITGKESEKSKILKVLDEMKEEMSDDLSIDNASDSNSIIFECGYKSSYYTINEVKEMFSLAKNHNGE